MSERDFEQPAEVLWLGIPARGASDHGTGRKFAKLADAVRFAMEQIPADVRGSAWIAVDGYSIMFAEIETLYAKLPKR